MNEEILQKLYDNGSKFFSLPDFETFVQDMQDEEKLARFRESMSQHYDIPDLETLKKDIGFSPKVVTEYQVEEYDPLQQDLTDKISRGEVEFDEETMGREDAVYNKRERKSLMNIGDMDVIYDKDASAFERSLAFVNKDLFERDEETVVPKLNYHFNDYGFKFEESGITDNVTVTAPDGTVEDFAIDSWLFASNKKESLKLRNFLRAHQRPSALNEIDRKYQNSRRKYFSRQAVDNDVKLIRAESADLAKRQKEWLDRNAKHEERMQMFINASPEEMKNPLFRQEYEVELAEGRYLAIEKDKLTAEYGAFESNAKAIDQVTGNYIMMKAEDPGFLDPFKGFYNKFLDGASSIVTSYLVDGALDVFYQLTGKVDSALGTEMTMDEEDFREAFIRNYKKFYEETYGPVPKDADTNQQIFKEWTDSLKGIMGGMKPKVEGEGFETITTDFIPLGATAPPDDPDYFKQPDGTYSGLDDSIYDMTKGIIYEMESPGIGLGQPVPVLKVYDKIDEEWVEAPGSMDMRKSIFDKTESIVRDQDLKQFKGPIKEYTRDMFGAMFGFDDVSDEKLEAQMNQGGALGVLATGWYGAGESIPALIPMIYAAMKGKKAKFTGAKGLGNKFKQSLKNFATDRYRQVSLLNMAALQNDKLMQEMENDPDFEFVTENEKKMLIAPLAIVTGMLETMGFRHLLRGTPGLATSIMKEALEKMPKGAAPSMFRRLVKNSIDNKLTRGVANSKLGKFGNRVLPAMAAEAETGGLQEVANIGAKDIYNSIKGKDLFEVPELWSEAYFDQVAFSAMAEAVGGFVMSTPGGIINAATTDNNTLVTDAMVELFDKIKNDQEFVNAYNTKIDLEVAQGKRSKLEGQKLKEQFAVLRSASTDLDMADDLDATQKKKALGLIFQKNEIESKMEGMDKDLGSYKKLADKLADIKTQLGQIGSEQVSKDAALEEEQKNIPIFEGEQTQQDASQEQSPVSEVSQDESTTTEEVAETVQDGVQESAGKGDTQTQNQDETTTKEEAKVETKEDIDAFFDENTESNDVVTPNISRNKADEKATNRPNTNKVKQIIRSAKMAAKALNKFFPNVRVVIHDNADLFTKTTGQKGKGYYNPNSKTIHINLQDANFTTVPHEAFHAMFMEKIKTDPAAARVAERMVRAIDKSLPKNSELSKRIQAFSKKYAGEQEMNEEKMAELFGIMSSDPGQFKKLPQTTKAKIIDIIDRMFKKLFGASPFTNAESRTDAKVIEFMETVSGKIRRGETVTQEDVTVLEEVEQETAPKKKQKTPPKKKPTQRKGREQRSVNEIIEQTNMNIYGFYPANMSLYDQQYVLNQLPDGYTFRKSRTNQYGQGGGFMLIAPNGRRVVPKQNRKGRLQKMDNENELVSLIAMGRHQGGFTDGGIREYLMRRMKDGKREFTTAEIDAALKVDTDLFTSMPKSFGNVDGGMLNGIKMLGKLNAFYKKLLVRNKKLPKGKKLSTEQMVEKVIEYMYTLPLYKKAGVKNSKKRTALQQALEAELIKYLNPKPTKANSARVKKLNAAIRNLKFSERNIKAVQRTLRQYIRSVLPVTMYGKGEVIAMIDKINKVNKDNFKIVVEEITDKVTTMTNNSLEQSIVDILTRKFQTIQSGRLKGIKIDNETYKRLKSIASDIIGITIDKKGKISYKKVKEITAEEVQKKNQKLLEKIENLSTETINGEKVNKTLTPEERAKVSDLQLAMSFNESLLLEQNDPIKTNALEQIEFSLNQLEEFGRTALQIQLLKDATGYMNRTLRVLEDMGVKIDPLAELEREGKENITQDDIIKKFIEMKKDIVVDAGRGSETTPKGFKRLKAVVGGILKQIDLKVIGSAEDLTGLMDRISLSTGEIFEGATQEIVSDQVRKATRMYKARMMANTGIIESKMTQLFGKKWTRMNMKNSQQTEEIVINKEKDIIIQKEIDRVTKDKKLSEGERSDLLSALHEAQNKNTMLLSQNQLLYFYTQGQDPSLLGSFETTFQPTKFSGKLSYLNQEFTNDYSSRVKEEIESKLDNRLIDFGKFLVEEYYPSQYDHYNKTYKEIYRTDMPWNQFYAGRLYRESGEDAEGLDLMPGANNQSWITNVGSASSKARTENNSAIMPTDAVDAVLNYTRDMEYFAAYAVPIRNIHKIFSDGAVRETINEQFGSDINTYINDAITKLANKGAQSQKQVNFINFFNTTFLLSRLGLNPTLTLKQLTSAVTYGNDIGYDNWLKMAVKSGPKGIKKDINEILENSVVLQDRYGEPITRAIETYAEEKFQKMNNEVLSTIGLTKGNLNTLTNILMATTMAGDKGAILIGGLPNYRFYKQQALDRGLTEQEAIDEAIIKFENDTLRTQQSYDLQDKDYFQTKGAFYRAFNMFLTTPKQYFRREIIGLRNFYRLSASKGQQGKGTLWQNARSVWVYHFVMPAFFQWVSMGLPGVFRDRREDDLKEIGISAMLGNLNALFILGDAAEMIVDNMTGKPWGTKAPSVPVLEQIANLNRLQRSYSTVKDPQKKAEYKFRYYNELATLVGIPAPQISRFIDNYSELIDSDNPGEALLRLFNFSQYQIEGPTKKKTKKKKSPRLTDRELREYFPDIYKEKRDAEREFEIEYADEIKEAERLKEEQRKMREEYLKEISE